MMSIGHRTKLFDVMAQLPPSTSERIATRAGLSERYVREWLAALVSGRIIAYEPTTHTYSLPPEHAACLTRAASLGNLAVYAQNVAMMGVMQDLIVERFSSGAGTRYEDYPSFHQIMAEDSDQTVVAPLLDKLLPLTGIVSRLDEGIDVLDAGCARGHALMAMAQRFPNSRFTGYDLCEDAIAYAAVQAQTAGLSNVCFAVQDLTDFDAHAQYDFIATFDAVHDQKSPQDYLKRLHRALRPAGVYLMQDIGGSAQLQNNLQFPLASFLYAISCIHCMPISLGQAGDGLGTMWGWETALAMLNAAGFVGIERHVLPHDPMNVWFVARKES